MPIYFSCHVYWHIPVCIISRRKRVRGQREASAPVIDQSQMSFAVSVHTWNKHLQKLLFYSSMCPGSSLPLSLNPSLWSVCCLSYLRWFHLFLCLYKKQTAPTSTPNSWFAPPISIGAMSTMGRREVFCDLYSITVFPHCPVCFLQPSSRTV